MLPTARLQHDSDTFHDPIDLLYFVTDILLLFGRWACDGIFYTEMNLNIRNTKLSDE